MYVKGDDVMLVRDVNKTHSFEAEQPKMVRMVKVHSVGVFEHEGSAECVLIRYPLCEV